MKLVKSFWENDEETREQYIHYAEVFHDEGFFLHVEIYDLAEMIYENRQRVMTKYERTENE